MIDCCFKLIKLPWISIFLSICIVRIHLMDAEAILHRFISVIQYPWIIFDTSPSNPRQISLSNVFSRWYSSFTFGRDGGFRELLASDESLKGQSQASHDGNHLKRHRLHSYLSNLLIFYYWYAGAMCGPFITSNHLAERGNFCLDSQPPCYNRLAIIEAH